jgi:hypothetical protein
MRAETDQDDHRAGRAMNGSLCQSCSFVKEIISGKGSRFLLCEKSQTDHAFAKYPRQPMIRCRGFLEKQGGNEMSAVKS